MKKYICILITLLVSSDSLGHIDYPIGTNHQIMRLVEASMACTKSLMPKQALSESELLKLNNDLLQVVFVRAGGRVSQWSQWLNNDLLKSVRAGEPDRSVNELLAAGADVNYQNNEGQTALMIASLLGHTELVKELLASNADPNIPDNDGNVALTFAEGNPKIVELLLEAGATERQLPS